MRPSRWQGLVAGLALACVSAVAFGLAFPPTALRPLAWVSLVPLFVALRSAGPGRALLIGWVWSLLAAWVTGDWLPSALSDYFLQSSLVGMLFFVGITSTMAAPYYMAFAVAYRPLSRRFGVASPLLLAAAWAAVELARGRLLNGTLFYFGSTPWAILGYSQVGADAVVQIASWTGVYGISFAIVACNAGIVEIGAAARLHRPSPWWIAAAAFPLVAVLSFGALTLRMAPPADAPPAADAVPVAIVQGNLNSGFRWRAELYGRNLQTYVDLTRDTFTESGPDIVFWPEAAMTLFLEQEPLYRRYLGRALGAHGERGVELIAGAVHEDAQTSPPRYFNSIFRIAPNGDLLKRYDKQFLVPFTETFPFRSVELLRRNFGRAREFTPGPNREPLPTRAGLAGILVCNEAMLPHVAALRVREGAVYLVNPSNDTWSSDEKFSLQQFDIVSLRAVELRRTLVRASTSGPSAIVDPWGRVRTATEPLTADVATGFVAPREELTPYARWGDWFGLGCALASGLALVAATRQSRGMR